MVRHEARHLDGVLGTLECAIGADFQGFLRRTSELGPPFIVPGDVVWRPGAGWGIARRVRAGAPRVRLVRRWLGEEELPFQKGTLVPLRSAAQAEGAVARAASEVWEALGGELDVDEALRSVQAPRFTTWSFQAGGVSPGRGRGGPGL